MVVCIFGASSSDIDKIYIEQVEALGEALGKRGHALMFGTGKHGLMGAAARGFYKTGAKIIGVAPTLFDGHGLYFDECTEFVSTDSMRDRKKYMEDCSDAFIAVPGGIGTYEELLECLTLKQLAQHAKPIVLFNINGFFNKFTALIDEDIKNGFVRPQTKELFRVCGSIDDVVSAVENDFTDINKIRFC